MMQKKIRSLLLWSAALAGPLTLAAQSKPVSHEVDLAVGYNALHGNATTGAAFWQQQGGFLELSATAFHGFGAAAFISGGHSINLNGSGVNLDTVTTTFGPRYTFRKRKLAVFGEGLIGESHGFNGTFPSTAGALSAFNTFALQVGGGADLRLSRHIAIRALEASWLRTEFPNATTNVQNNLQLGAGVVFLLQK